MLGITGDVEGSAGNDTDDARGLQLRYVSGCALAYPKKISTTVETHLETNDEGPKLDTVRVGVPKEEKIDWVLVGDNPVPDFS